MHFLIWLPDDPAVKCGKNAHLEVVGLGDLAPGAHFEQLAAGPDGHSGHLVSWHTPEKRYWPYEPARQTWQPAAPHQDLPAARYWIGWQSGHPPAPRDLLVRRPFDGPMVMLGDGQHWMLPRPDWLPWDVVLADDGSYRYEPQVRFTRYIVLCREWQARMDDPAQRETIYLHELAEFVSAALSINYRLPRELPSILRLFSTGPGGTLKAALELLVRVEP